MSQLQAEDVDTRPVINVAESHSVKAQELSTNLKTLAAHFLEVAALFSDDNQSAKVASLREGYAELLKMDQEVQAYTAALDQEVCQNYAPNGVAATKFDHVLDKATKEILKQRKFDVERCEEMRQFDQDTGAKGAAGGDSDDDVVMEQSALVNDRCPITRKSVMELVEPVEDKKGYIYEKEHILQMLRQARGQPIKCPEAGTSHMVTLAELRPSRRVQREKRRQVFQGTQAGGTQAAGRAEENVVDADDV
mmetsp:Transcript_138/g.301  ORF Transcript_138/g.301 Transcript_138/m.301 type:complete len:250 (-) Transcript_138:266-1015(-)